MLAALVLVLELFDGLGVNVLTILRTHLAALFRALVRITETHHDDIARSKYNILMLLLCIHQFRM